MKRDWDVIRKILITVENKDNLQTTQLGDFETVDPKTVSYNVDLLIEQGYLKGKMIKALGAREFYSFIIYSITFDGHDLLDSIRNDTIWNKTKNKLGNLLTEVPVEIVKNIAAGFLLDHIKNL